MRTFDSMTLYRQVGCGSIYCIFSEREDGEFYNLIIKGDNAREAPCGESWMNAIAAILTYTLRRSLWEGNTQKAIIRHLLNHQCHIPIRNWQDKTTMHSCAHAIGEMCLEYIKSRGFDEIEKEKEETLQPSETKT